MSALRAKVFVCFVCSMPKEARSLVDVSYSYWSLSMALLGVDCSNRMNTHMPVCLRSEIKIIKRTRRS